MRARRPPDSSAGSDVAPADYGLMAMASVLTTFVALFRDLGTAAAIVRAQELDEAAVSAVFWGNLALGCTIGVVVAVGAPLAEQVLRAEGLRDILFGIAATFPLTALGFTHGALLEREERFRALFVVEVSASTLALAVAIIAAHQACGVHSLVLQALTQAFISSVLLWGARPWIPARAFDPRRARSLFRFGSYFTAFSILNYASRNADNAIIGRTLGADVLGTYSIAYKLMLFPVQYVSQVASRALLPSLARSLTNDDCAAVYLKSIRLIALLTAPATSLLFILRSPLVLLVFGDQWATAADLLVWLAPTGFVQSIFSSSGALIAARGQPRTLLSLAACGMALNLGAFLLGSRTDITRLTIYYFLANAAQGVLCLYVATTVIRSSLLVLARQLWTPALRGLATGAAASLIIGILELGESHKMATLIVTVLLCCLFWLGLLLVCPSQDRKLVLQALKGERSNGG
jgi:O-antigen/teichoic acid export membrane protein